jgi:hypothetical protein
MLPMPPVTKDLRFLSACLFFILYTSLLRPAVAQTYFAPENWIDRLNLTGALPEKLLSTRTAVFYDYTLTEKELLTAQEYFQRSGIDAVAYFDLDMLMASNDVTRSFGDYLLKREFANLVFIEKGDPGYRITITSFNGKETVLDAKQAAWSVRHGNLTEALKTVYRTSASGLKKLNLLINDQPETGLTVNPILGRRNEFFAMDLKVDPLAVPKFGDEALDKELEQLFKDNYTLKYKMTEPGVSDKDLRKQGSLYVLCIVRTRGSVAKELLGYQVKAGETALASVTYPGPQQELRNIPSDQVVYKVYFKHIDSGNVFLGTKWDADTTWQQALLNQLRGMKAELRLN